MLKLFQPYIHHSAIENVVKVLSGTQLAEGPQVKAFESEFSYFFKKRNVLALNSGTAALELAYELAGIGEGDEVVTPVLTCTATNLPLLHRGAVIKWVDTDYDLNIDIADLLRKVNSRTKAIVFVHFGGNNRGLKEALTLAKHYNIPLIEDAAQAVGSPNWGVGDFTAVSLQAIKTLTTGDGGLLLCKKDSDHEKAKRLRWFGIEREKKQQEGDVDVTEAGYKYHMNDIAAAIGRGNMTAMSDILAHRKKLMHAYQRNDINANIWFAYVYSNDMENLQRKLANAGIESGVHHYRNDKYTVFGGRKPLPKMDEIEDKYLLLPLHMGVSESDVDVIGNIVRHD